MAHAHVEENETLKPGEGSASFNFDAWITKHGLQEIKLIFKEHDMCSLNTISMNNKNFAELMRDYRVLAKANLIPNIIEAVQSLQSLQESKLSLIFMSKQENIILKRLQQYVDNMYKLQEEYKTFNDEY
eukprot:149603_1